jgi:hypothetical protein
VPHEVCPASAHAVAQQNPFDPHGKPPAHSSPTTHAAPAAIFVAHTFALQNAPAVHCVSTVQLVPQLVPLHRYVEHELVPPAVHVPAALHVDGAVSVLPEHDPAAHWLPTAYFWQAPLPDAH